MGTHLTVKVGDQTQEIVLGPAKFIANKEFSFAKGDSVEVTGSKVTMGGTAYIIAREVIKDGKTLTLRDKSGTPQWAGMMGRRPR
jgi:DNA/RNA endonuclease YhcR with UshA esterase domain